LKPGNRVAKKYLLEARIGSGAAGSVWSAVNELTGRRVALKLLHAVNRVEPEARERLLREARACGRVHHRNVVDIYDVGSVDVSSLEGGSKAAGGSASADSGTPYLVMELLSGETLEQRLKRVGTLDAREAGAIAAQVAAGLAAAHDSDIVHRDLKPANLYLHRDPTGKETLKILDFGVSKILASSEGMQTITGSPLGSPAYMAPEQARGDKGIDGKADVWALGVVTFEMLTRSLPFVGRSVYEVVAAVVGRPIPNLAELVPGTDPRLTELFARSVVREKPGRMDAREAAALLAGFIDAPGRVRTFSIPSMGVARDVQVAFRAASGPASTSSDDQPTLVRPASFEEEEPTLKYRKTPRNKPAEPAPRSAPSLQATISDAEITRDLRFGAHASLPALAEATAAEVARARTRRRLTQIVVLTAGLLIGGAVALVSSCSSSSPPAAAPP
jgi:serine/threonine-protein kinase